MGFNLSSFAGGFATAFTEDIEKEEKLAEVRGISGVKNMADTYKTVMAENRKLKSELVENVNTLQGYDPAATQQELFEIAKSKPLMDIIASKIKSGEFKDNGFKLSDYARVVKDNTEATAMERIEEMFKLPKVEDAAPTEVKKTGNIIRDITATAGSKAGERAARETAAALGVTLEELRAAKAFKTPDITSAATVNMEAVRKQPQNAKDIKDKLDVAVIQAAQQFGENSPQYVEAKNKVDTVKTQIDKLEGVVDKSLEARVNRLMVKRADTTDPAQIKSLDNEIKSLQSSIKQHNQATRATDPKEKEATYNQMKTSVNDYVNTRMKEDKGFDWNKYVDFKTFTDPATDTTVTSRTQKAGLSIEDQRVLFAKERQLTAQALKANGYVLSDGTPRTPVAQQLMTNFNISPNELAAKETPTEKPLPMANAAPTASAPAQPAARPVPQLTREDQDALVWANNPANAGPKADAIKKKIQNKINGAN